MAQIGRPPCDEAVIRHAASDAQASGCPASARKWVLVATILGSSMAFIDGTVVNVALPAIQRDLGASAFDAQWVVESYALFLAALLLAGGSLGDRFGRRRVFLIGVAVFVAASIACGLSANVSQLIAARALQGVGAALLVPGSLALISANYPAAERGRAIGTWSGASGITAALGPVLGGWLVDNYSWTWAFLINLPVGVAVLAVAGFGVPADRPPEPGARSDIAGTFLATIGLGGVVYAFIEAPVRGWSSPLVLTAAAGGAAALVAFILVEKRASAPMLPFGLFRSRDFTGANLLTLMLYAALGGGLYFFPLNLIQVQGFSATAAGAALLPFILIMFLFSRWAGQLVDRVGAKVPLVAGPLVAAVGFALFALPGIGGSYWVAWFPAVVVLGIGMTLTVAPLTTTVMNAVATQFAGVASGVNNAVSRTAALLAIAVFGLVLAWAFETGLQRQLATAAIAQPVKDQLLESRGRLADAAHAVQSDPQTERAARRIVGESFVAGFRWVMLLSAGLAVLAALAAWLSISARVPRTGEAR